MKKQTNEFKDIDKNLKDKAGCKTCYGHGLWATGDSSPMGPIDFLDGCPSIKCPECGRGGR